MNYFTRLLCTWSIKPSDNICSYVSHICSYVSYICSYVSYICNRSIYNLFSVNILTHYCIFD